MTDTEPDLDLSWLLTPIEAPSDGLGAIRARAARRQRRNRITLAAIGALAIVTATTVGIAAQRTGPSANGTTVRVGSSPTVAPSTTIVVAGGATPETATTSTAALPARCAGGAIPAAGQAREGDGVSFGVLPSGFSVVAPPATPLLDQTQADAAGPDNGSLQVRLIIATPLDTDMTNGPSQPITIQGHRASLIVSPEPPSQASIIWSPGNGLLIEVVAGGVTTTTAEAVAQQVRLDPGRTAPSVGDLGPVVPRAVVVASATKTASSVGPVTAAHAILVTADQFYRLSQERGTGVRVTDPIWVVELTGTFPIRFGNPSGGPTASIETDAYDAVSGEELGVSIGGSFPTGLTDHSTSPPCPLPPQD